MWYLSRKLAITPVLQGGRLQLFHKLSYKSVGLWTDTSIDLYPYAAYICIVKKIKRNI